MKVSKTPYYYMADLADLDEKLGRKDAAIAWLEKAYRESRGHATRFQWGTAYVHGLVRMRPQDEAAISAAAREVLGELDGQDRIYQRTKARLDKLDTSLREWNAGGKHGKAIAAIRNRMTEICGRIPQSESSARESCEGFLAVRET
jgi:protein disulfide-isomerase